MAACSRLGVPENTRIIYRAALKRSAFALLLAAINLTARLSVARLAERALVLIVATVLARRVLVGMIRLSPIWLRRILGGAILGSRILVVAVDVCRLGIVLLIVATVPRIRFTTRLVRRTLISLIEILASTIDRATSIVANFRSIELDGCLIPFAVD